MVAPTHPETEIRPAGKWEQKLTATERFVVPEAPAADPGDSQSTEKTQVSTGDRLSAALVVALAMAFFAFIIWLAAQQPATHYDPTWDYWMY